MYEKHYLEIKKIVSGVKSITFEENEKKLRKSKSPFLHNFVH